MSGEGRTGLRVWARLILAATVTVVGVAVARDELPQDPAGGPFVEDVLGPVQYALLALVTVGGLAGLRWRRAELVIVTGAGFFLAMVTALHYRNPVPGLVGLAMIGPAMMLWIDWLTGRPRWQVVGSVATTAVVTAGIGLGASAVHDVFLGPTHPASAAERLPESAVRWMWSGAVGPTGFTVTVVPEEAARVAAMVVSPAAGGDPVRSDPVGRVEAGEPIRFAVDGLAPSTRYEYRVELDGVIDAIRVGMVETFPDGPASVTLAFGSCARTHSNGAVFDTIRGIDPDVYVMIGDNHYRDIVDDDPRQFAAAYDQIHASPARSWLYRSVPIAYVWDDHDYGANDSDASSPSRPAAWSTYREFVPHYPLPAGTSGSIHQAFTVGRVRVVMLDTRSHRSAERASMLGPEQLEWLLDEVAESSSTHAVVVVVSPTTWIGAAEPGADHWGAFASERDAIGAHLATLDIANVVMVGGDAHMVAIDDGTNSGYGGHQGFPLLQAAALDRPGSVKGGPYSHGTHAGGGRFGVVEVTDDGGDTVGVELIGIDWEGRVLTSYETSFRVP